MTSHLTIIRYGASATRFAHELLVDEFLIPPFRDGLGPSAPIQDQGLKGRHDDEQQNWPDQHATYNYGGERPLNLAADSG